jgi:hypothetical protein
MYFHISISKIMGISKFGIYHKGVIFLTLYDSCLL